MKNLPIILIKSYGAHVKYKNPVKTKMMTAFVLFGVTDMFSQLMEMATSWDTYRTFRMASTKMFVVNPISQFYYNYVVDLWDIKRFVKTRRSVKIWNSLLRSFMHSTVMGPVVNSSILFFPAVLKNFDLMEGVVNWKSKIITATMGGYMFWPMMDFINYQFNPKYLR